MSGDVKAVTVDPVEATLIALGHKTILTTDFDPFPQGPSGYTNESCPKCDRPMRYHAEGGMACPDFTPGERIAIVAGAQGPGWLSRADVGQAALPLPLGAVVCTVTVDDALPIVVPMTDPPHDHLTPTTDGHLMWWKFTPVMGQRRWSAASRHPMLNERTVVGGRRDPDLDPQLPLGDFTPGRWGWLLSDPQPCDPIPCKGKQGVFVLPDDVAAQIGGGR